MVMTSNERLILNELAAAAIPLSKRDVTHRCGMGWATAVKLMTRLEEQGYIVPSGNERQNQAGKSAAVYTLSEVKPAAIGIDIEYRRIRLTIRNLAQKCLYQSEQSTPAIRTPEALIDFLEHLLHQGISKATELGVVLEGAGIGVPNHLFGQDGVPYTSIGEQLTVRVGLPIVLDNNIRCFTAAVASLHKNRESLIVITVRSGIGAGILVDGRIYHGDRGCSGEIGHFPVEKNEALCRCGKSGCLETVVNREILATALKDSSLGDKAAQKRLDTAAGLLGKAIATTMLVLDIRRVAVYAELDDPAQRVLVPVRAAITKTINPGFDFDVRYERLDPEAYVAGAAWLVLNEFVG